MKTTILSALAAATPFVVQGNEMENFERIVGGNTAVKGQFPYYGKNVPPSLIPMTWRNAFVSNVISFLLSSSYSSIGRMRWYAHPSRYRHDGGSLQQP